MNVNYEIVGLVLLAVIALVVFLIIRNQKDKKKLEQQLNDTEITPDKHDKDKR